MAVSYNKLWKLLIDKGMTKTELRHKADLGTTTIAKLGKAQSVSMDVMLRICSILNCNISDVMDFVPTDKKENGNA
jgi:DNA-binding Xre family transcriptional regulator